VTIDRRQFLHLAAGAIVPAVPRSALAQAYPSRPIRLVVGFPPGGGTDPIARLMGQALSERLGQPFVIENRPGAGTNIGTEAVGTLRPLGVTTATRSDALPDVPAIGEFVPGMRPASGTASVSRPKRRPRSSSG
jgi:tripartite-type tricarboxylate transporter receptor subunit TctC